MSRKNDSFDKAFKVIGTMVVIYMLGALGLLGFVAWAVYSIVKAIVG